MNKYELKLPTDKFVICHQQYIQALSEQPKRKLGKSPPQQNAKITRIDLRHTLQNNFMQSQEGFQRTLRNKPTILLVNKGTKPYLVDQDKMAEFQDIHVLGIRGTFFNDVVKGQTKPVYRFGEETIQTSKVQRANQVHFFPKQLSQHFRSATYIKNQQSKEVTQVPQKTSQNLEILIPKDETLPISQYYHGQEVKYTSRKNQVFTKRMTSAYSLQSSQKQDLIDLMRNKVTQLEVEPLNLESEDPANLNTSQELINRVTFTEETRKKIRKARDVSSSLEKKWKAKLKKSVIPDLSQLPIQKFHQYRQFMMAFNISNNIVIVPQEFHVPTFKAIVTKGNNGIVVRNCLKQRWWWTLVDKANPLEDVNLIWNQNRKLEFYDLIPKGHDMVKYQKFLQVVEYEKQEQNQQPNQKSYRGISRHFQHCFNEPQMKKLAPLLADLKSYKPPKTNREYPQDPYEPYDTDEITRLTIKYNNNSRLVKINKVSFLKSQNHLEKNFQITNKKALFYNISFYYKQMDKNPFDYIPLTFHIQKGSKDLEFQRFQDVFETRGQNNYWIIKPGENTNRGNGIEVSSSLSEIRSIVNSRVMHSGGKPKTYIIQEYIQRPLLYNRRKFDIRCFMVMTATNGVIKGYWYKEGYVRTSSREFNVNDLENKMIHLTNDAVQKKGEEYGKYESGNKVSFSDFAKYLDTNYPDQKIDFEGQIVGKFKLLAKDVIACGYSLMDPNKRLHSFELFGLDFMIDENFRPWLIEVNNNPCLETSCSLLNRIIPSVVEQVFRVAIDPMFPPPQKFQRSKLKYFQEDYPNQNKMELIFDSCEEVFARVKEDLPEMDDDDLIDGDD